MIRDNGNAFYDRINSKEHMESQDDALEVSGIAEDIRDALLEYQVGNDIPRAVVGLNWDVLKGGPTKGDIRSELQADCKSSNTCVGDVSDFPRLPGFLFGPSVFSLNQTH